MKQVRMKAVRPMRYRTRRLLAGDDYVCSPQRGRLDVAIGKAVYAPAVAEPKPVQHVDPDAHLRARYFELSGNEPSKRWGAARLQKEIDALTNAPPPAPSVEPVPDAGGEAAVEAGGDPVPDAGGEAAVEAGGDPVPDVSGDELLSEAFPEAGSDDDDQNGSLI